MREKEKHLMDIPLARLSRLSQLVTELRTNHEAIGEYESFSKFCMAVLAIETDGADSGFDDLLAAIADLIMEAVYPDKQPIERRYPRGNIRA